jgi:hypothetical protein
MNSDCSIYKIALCGVAGDVEALLGGGYDAVLNDLYPSPYIIRSSNSRRVT